VNVCYLRTSGNGKPKGEQQKKSRRRKEEKEKSLKKNLRTIDGTKSKKTKGQTIIKLPEPNYAELRGRPLSIWVFTAEGGRGWETLCCSGRRCGRRGGRVVEGRGVSVSPCSRVRSEGEVNKRVRVWAWVCGEGEVGGRVCGGGD